MSKDLAIQNNEIKAQDVQWDLHPEAINRKPLEFSDEIKPELYGLKVSEAHDLAGGIDVIKAELDVLKNAYIDVISLEITTENQPVFKDLRKSFTKNRTSAEKLRKAKKSYFLNGGRFVDAIFKNIEAERELMESKLLEAEKFFENKAKEEKAKLNSERLEKLKPYIEDVTGLDFSEMNDYDFDDYVLGKKTRFEAEQKEKLEAEAWAKKELEREKIKSSNKKALLPWEIFIKNFESIDFENVDLICVLDSAKNKKTEADKKNKEQEEENEKLKAEADKQAKIQAEQNAKIAELKAKEDARIKAENDARIKAENDAKELAKAPIKEQLNAWLDTFGYDSKPIDNEVSKEIVAKFEAFKKWAKSEIDKM